MCWHALPEERGGASGQRKQEILPGDAAYDPGEQGTHSLAPDLFWYVPGAHGAHAGAAAAGANEPGPQGTHAEAPRSAAAVPGSHGAHAPAPTPADPGAHCACSTADAGPMHGHSAQPEETPDITDSIQPA